MFGLSVTLHNTDFIRPNICIEIRLCVSQFSKLRKKENYGYKEYLGPNLKICKFSGEKNIWFWIKLK
jgi:hypothetical protein